MHDWRQAWNSRDAHLLSTGQMFVPEKSGIAHLQNEAELIPMDQVPVRYDDDGQAELSTTFHDDRSNDGRHTCHAQSSFMEQTQ